MKTILATLVLAFPAIAVVAETPLIPKDNFASTRSRAEVDREVLNSRADGTLAVVGEIGMVPAPTISSSKTRDQVRAEAAGVAHRQNAQRASFSGSYLPG